MKCTLLGMGLVVTLALAQPLRADLEQPAKVAVEADPRAKIDEIDKKVEALQQEKQQLERQAEEKERRDRQREELADVQRQGNERLQQIDKELAELAQAEATDSVAGKAQRQAQTTFLKDQRKLIEEIMDVKDIADLPKVREIRERSEELETEWDLVRGPQLEANRRLEELDKRAQGDEGTPAQRELLPQIHALAEADAITRRAEFDARKTHRANEKNFDALVDRFWNGR